jgi:hypothetical protein
MYGQNSDHNEKLWTHTHTHTHIYIYVLKSSLENFDFNLDTWETTTLNRTAWCSALHKLAAANEESKRLAAVQRRQARKSRTVRPTAEANIPCPYFSRTFQAGIGLISH